MTVDIQSLEPADRDPAQLRRTALVLLVLMVVGGLVIAFAYLKLLERQAQDPRPGVISRIDKRFAAFNQDRETFDTLELEGKVTLLTPVCLAQAGHTAEALRVMKLVAERFEDEPRLRFVALTVDPARDEPEDLKAFAGELGVDDDARWQLVATIPEEADATRNYLREELRFGVIKEQDTGENKGLDFRSMIAVIDSHLHLRGQYEPNDAVRVQDYARKLLEEDPEQAARENAAGHTDDLEALEERVLQVVGLLLEEQLEGKQPKR